MQLWRMIVSILLIFQVPWLWEVSQARAKNAIIPFSFSIRERRVLGGRVQEHIHSNQLFKNEQWQHSAMLFIGRSKGFPRQWAVGFMSPWAYWTHGPTGPGPWHQWAPRPGPLVPTVRWSMVPMVPWCQWSQYIPLQMYFLNLIPCQSR